MFKPFENLFYILFWWRGIHATFCLIPFLRRHKSARILFNARADGHCRHDARLLRHTQCAVKKIYEDIAQFILIVCLQEMSRHAEEKTKDTKHNISTPFIYKILNCKISVKWKTLKFIFKILYSFVIFQKLPSIYYIRLYTDFSTLCRVRVPCTVMYPWLRTTLSSVSLVLYETRSIQVQP